MSKAKTTEINDTNNIININHRLMWTLIVIIIIVLVIMYSSSQKNTATTSVGARVQGLSYESRCQHLRNNTQIATYGIIENMRKEAGAKLGSKEESLRALDAIIAVRQFLMNDLNKLSREYSLPESTVLDIIDTELTDIWLKFNK